MAASMLLLRRASPRPCTGARGLLLRQASGVTRHTTEVLSTYLCSASPSGSAVGSRSRESTSASSLPDPRGCMTCGASLGRAWTPANSWRQRAIVTGCGRRAAATASGSGDLPREAEGTPTLGELLAAEGEQRFIFVGGKGGVGKTTTAAALAVRLAAFGRRTLVVSTDPAHSLGDALAMELSGEPRQVDLDGLRDRDEKGSLYAMEIDPCEVVEDFRRALRLHELRAALKESRGGLGAGVLSALAKAGVDLEALATLLELAPPGIDEAVALTRIMQLLGEGEHGEFERVVIDTAPTGHTLRLLSFPRFLHALIGTALSVTEKVSAFSPMSSLFGQLVGDDLQQQLKVSKSYLERLMASMSSIGAVFTDADRTNFVMVAIPTHLAVAESKRLLKALEEARMPVRHVIMNKCSFLHEDGSIDHTSDAASEKVIRALDTAYTGGETHAQEALGLSEAEASAVRRTLERLTKQRREALHQVQSFVSEVGDEVRVLQACMLSEEDLTGPSALDRYARALCAG